MKEHTHKICIDSTCNQPAQGKGSYCAFHLKLVRKQGLCGLKARPVYYWGK